MSQHGAPVPQGQSQPRGWIRALCTGPLVLPEPLGCHKSLWIAVEAGLFFPHRHRAMLLLSALIDSASQVSHEVVIANEGTVTDSGPHPESPS